MVGVQDLSENWRTLVRVDEVVQNAYLDAKIEKDMHLKFMRDYLLYDNKKLRKTLKTYQKD